VDHFLILIALLVLRLFRAMKTVNKNNRWWVGIEKEWAYQDKAGDWWIFRDKKVQTKPIKRKQRQMSARLSAKDYIILVLFSALGVSLALNVVGLIA